MPQRYIMSHTSIRGIAALLVVFYHLQFGADVYFPWEIATPFFRKGYLWVDLFFILSGFVISYSARTDERAPLSRDQVKAFWVARLARIYPLHLFCLMLTFFETLAFAILGSIAHKPFVAPETWSPLSLLNFVEQIFLLNGWGLTGLVGWNIPTWSISAEMVAYLLFPAMAAGMVRHRTLMLVAMPLAAIVFYAWIGMTTGILDIVKGTAIMRCLAGFSLGMVLYGMRDALDRLPTGVLSLLQLIALLPVMAALFLGLNDVLAIPGFVLLVASTWPDRGLLARALKTSVLHWLGEISYSVYLNHLWVLGAWHFVMIRVVKYIGLPPLTGRAVIMSGGIILILIISHLTYRYVEGPARNLIVARYRRRVTPLSPSTLHVENSLT